MGAYLSSPVTQTNPEDGESHKLSFGASSMQGWRVSQEDAHCAVIEFNKERDESLFAVFDGHGGSEVAEYCAKNLPQFIATLPSYQKANFREALEDAFLQFDATLVTPQVVQQLRHLAGIEMDKQVEDNDSEDEMSLLRQEADIPIEDLMARYADHTPSVMFENEMECSSSSNISLRLPLPSHLKQNAKPLSPFLRAKRSDINDSNEPTCSSSCDGDTSTPQTTNEVSDSASNSISQPDSTIKTDSESLKDDSNENSLQLSNGETGSGDKINSSECEVSQHKVDKDLPQNDNEITTSVNSDVNIVNNNNNDNNNGITSTNSSLKSDASNDSECAVKNDITSDVSETPTFKGKGKQKKIIAPKIKRTGITEEDAGPIYNTFLNDFDESDDASDDDSDDFNANLPFDDDDDDEEDDNESEDEDEDDDDDDDDDEDEHDISGADDEQTGGVYEEPGRDSGCTAVVALIKGNELYVANAGDSRCVVSRNGKAVEMSIDHKPEDEIERLRVEKAGGKVTSDGRVNGGLNLSRAIGDHSYKDNPNVSAREQMITALPDIKSLSLEFPNDEFMVIACDGIWNSLSSQQVIDFINERINKVNKLSTICDELFKRCLAPNTVGDGTGCDNMTCIIVKFGNSSPKRKADFDDEVSAFVDTCDKSVEPEFKRMKDNHEVDGTIDTQELHV